MFQRGRGGNECVFTFGPDFRVQATGGTWCGSDQAEDRGGEIVFVPAVRIAGTGCRFRFVDDNSFQVVCDIIVVIG